MAGTDKRKRSRPPTEIRVPPKEGSAVQLIILLNRSPHRLVQKLLVLTSRLRAFRLITLLLCTIRTRLVLSTADRWRVTMKSAWFCTRPLTVARTCRLAWALISSAVLLRTRTWPLVRTVWVTASSRPRFRSMPEVLLPSLTRQLLGRAWTKRLVPVVPVVVTILLLAVLRWLQWTPLTTAFPNS